MHGLLMRLDHDSQGYLYLNELQVNTNMMSEVIDLETVLDSESETDLESAEVWSKLEQAAQLYLCLDRLKAPKASDLSRKQKVNPPCSKAKFIRTCMSIYCVEPSS